MEISLSHDATVRSLGGIDTPKADSSEEHNRSKETKNLPSLISLRKKSNASIYSDDVLRLSMLEIKRTFSEFIQPKNNNAVLNEEPGQEINEGRQYTGRMSPWRKLAIVTRSIQRFRSPIVEKIRNAEKLKKSIASWSPVRGNTRDHSSMIITHGHMQRSAMREFRDQSHFFEALERGSPSDLEAIRKALSQDPKKNLYEEGSLQRLSNKPNAYGQTPLYVACKNGNLELVKLLLENEANPYQPCSILNNENEVILVVAAKWGYADLVKYLLGSQFQWKEEDLRKAKQKASVKEIRSVLKARLKKGKNIFKRLLSPRTSAK